MVLKENDKYKVHKIHSSADVKGGKENTTMHKSFIIKGKPDFDGLDLMEEYKWKNIHSLNPQQRKALENDPNYICCEETKVYRGPQGIAIAYLNYKTNIHQIDININNQKDNEDSMKAVKSMFELELGFTLNDEGTEIEDPIRGLLKKLKNN
jgi:hypothetical protein